MMSSEEAGDLLLNISEESDSDISDYYIEEKILHLLENDKSNDKTWTDSVILITSSLLLFISSTSLLITLPVYIEHSNRCGIDVYSKIVTIATFNVVLFTVICALNRWLKRILSPPKSTSRLYMCLPNILKASSLLTIASLLVFYLINEELVSCHLQDPIKGCVVVFSFLFYFVFSKRKTSVERVFCSITVIVGTFITVDFGLCDRYRCRGNENINVNYAHIHTTYHVFYVVGYIVALAAFTLHFTCLENCFRSFNSSSSMDLSIVSSRERLAPPSPIAQSLSIISGGGGGRSEPRLREPLNVSVPITNSDNKCKFPMTSTPNEGGPPQCVLDYTDWLAAHHTLLWLVVALFVWFPTIQFFNKEPKSLVVVFNDILSSFVCHVTGSNCSGLWLPSTIVLASYFFFCVSSMILLAVSHSALTVICVTVNALPMASLFWSVYQLDSQSLELVLFNMSVTGETISAMLGFPIIAVGTLIILKSHVLHPVLYLRLH